MKEDKRKASPQYSTNLDLFARAFTSEDHLRKVISDLFWKMGHQGVRITHGPNEKGKDIVFYSRGPLGERLLFACVVKNAPITGQADDLKTGAPTIVSRLQPVLNQVTAAFAEPLANGQGVDERVNMVYVISPYDCPIATIESVKTSIQRGGQIVFKCGQELLELFAEHWPEFLWFESTVLLSYLSALRTDLEDDYALVNLILRKSHLADSPSALAERYIEPTFHRELREHSRIAQFGPNLELLTRSVAHSDVQEETKSAKLTEQLLHTAQLWADEVQVLKANQVGKDVGRIAAEIEKLWDTAYQQYVAKVLEDSHRSERSRGGRSFAKSRYPTDAAAGPSKREVFVTLNQSEAFTHDAHCVAREVVSLSLELQSLVDKANEFARIPHPDPIAALRSHAFRSYSQVSETAKLVPFALEATSSRGQLEFGENLPDQFPGSLLITAPAGFGKTTFCRWHAIADANRLANKQAKTLPVYIALHSRSFGNVDSFQDAFFQNERLRTLVQPQSANTRAFDRIRLYLDGLDEVTSLDRQRRLMELAQEAARQWNFLQVIVTGRDHIAGPWLGWLPRVRLSPLTDEKSKQLACKWLGAEHVDAFFARLSETRSLGSMMRIPLLATLILAVYRRTGTVPPNKTDLYLLFVELLCGGWDVYKNIQRHNNLFSTGNKIIVLTRLAGILQLQNKRDATGGDFRSAVKNTLPALSNDCQQLLSEIVEDGLTVRVGADTAFSHLSFQEFLAAKDLHDFTGNRPKVAMTRYFDGGDWWKEVLAFYVTMSSRPGEMDEWIAKRALATRSTVGDLEERTSYLRKSLAGAFPEYSENSAVKELFVQVAKKAKRLASRKDQL